MVYIPNVLSLLRQYIPSSKTGRIVLVATGSTIVVLSVVGVYLRRRRRKYSPAHSDESVDYNRLRGATIMSPCANSTVATVSSTPYPSCYTADSRYPWRPASQFQTTDDLCAAGLQAIQASVDYWQAAVTRLRNRTIHPDSADESMSGSGMNSFATVQHLEALIEHAHRVEELYQQHHLSLHSAATSVTGVRSMESTGPTPNGGVSLNHPQSVGAGQVVTDGPILNLGELICASPFLGVSRPLARSDTSSADSFVSANMQIDSPEPGVQGPRELSSRGMDITFYLKGEAAVLSGQVPCRSLRTQMLQCLSDRDFLAKLHCVRQAFHRILMNEKNREWIVSSGSRLISLFLQAAGKESQAFMNEYQAMMAYVESTDIDEMFDELKERKLVHFSFYDVVLDFALMDAFADLEHPPSTITSVLANRWLTNGFKETALNTTVWSVVKAKRSMLQKSDGFMHHFYNVMSTLSPVLAWGFLGPDHSLRSQCAVFKDQLLRLMRDIFSLTTVRYSSVEDLSDDIMDSTKMTYQQLVEHFQASMASP